jgi:hypothetical protein
MSLQQEMQQQKCYNTSSHELERQLTQAFCIPPRKAANYATPRNLLLFQVQNNTAIRILSLLLSHFKRSAITMTTHIQSLQFIVIYKMIPVSEGAQQDAPATILQKLKLIVDTET